MISKQQFYTCNIICPKAFVNLCKILWKCVPKLFLNYGINMFNLIKKYFRFQGWNSYIRTIYQPADIATEFDNVVYVCDSKLAALKMITIEPYFRFPERNSETKQSFFRSWKARTMQCQKPDNSSSSYKRTYHSSRIICGQF